MINDKVNSLKEKVAILRNDRDRTVNKFTTESDISWNSSSFIAQLILENNNTNDYGSYSAFKIFLNQFNDSRNTNFEPHSFIDKHWVRFVCNKIHIPNAVRSYINSFEKVKNQEIELAFLFHLNTKYPAPDFSERKKGNLSLKQYKREVTNYEKSHSALNQIWIQKSNQYKELDNGNIRLGQVDYYNTLINNWLEFECLYAFYEEVYLKKIYDIRVPINDLVAILESHSQVYKRTPDIDELIDLKLLEKTGSNYKIDAYNGPINFQADFNDKVGALVWREITSGQENSDKKVLRFLSYFDFADSPPIITNYSTNAEQKVFAEGAMKLLLKEKDLSPLENEMQKVVLDEGFTASSQTFGMGFHKKLMPLEYKDELFEMYQQIELFSKQTGVNTFVVQDSRADLGYLISQVVSIEAHTQVNAYNPLSQEDSLIAQLLDAGLNKPYLLNRTISVIHWRFPALFIDMALCEKYAALAIQQLAEYGVNNGISNYKTVIKEDVVLGVIEIALKNLTKSNNAENKAYIIYNCYLLIAKNKFIQNKNIKTIEELEIIELRNEQNLNNYLQLVEKRWPNNVSAYLLKLAVITELIKLFGKYKVDTHFNNGVLRFPSLGISGLSWIAKYCSTSQFRNKVEDLSKTKNAIYKAFKKSYIKHIEAKSASMVTIYGENKKSKRAIWSASTEEIQKIDWAPLAIILHQTNHLSSFLNLTFKLEYTNTEMAYDKILFNVEKFRTHLLVIIRMLLDINKPDNISLLTTKERQKITDTAEKRIIEIVELYGYNKYDKDEQWKWVKDRANILSPENEKGLFNRENKELIPLIIEVANCSKNNKENLLDAILDKADVLRLLSILRDINFSSIRERCNKIINNLEISQEIKLLNRDKIVNVISELSKFEELKNQASTAIDYWDNEVYKKQLSEQEEYSIFESKLTVAYHNRDVKALDTISYDRKIYRIEKSIKPKDHKQFIKGLISYEERQYQKAFNVFELLFNSYPSIPTFALNKFSAALQIGIENNSKLEVEQALKLWSEEEKYLNIKYFNGIAPKVIENKLIAFKFLNLKEDYDKLYSGLAQQEKMTQELIEIHCSYLKSIGLNEEARKLKMDGVQYHNINKTSYNDAVKIIQTLETEESVKQMRATLNRISKLSGDHFAQVANNELRQDSDIGSYLLIKILKVVDLYLLKTASIRKLKMEDSYSDLIEVGLRLSLSEWGFIIYPQSTAGLSESKKSAGERDLVIARGTTELGVFEALMYRGKSKLQTHMTKIFNYSHRRDRYYVIIYDDHPSAESFDKRWNKYWNALIPNLNYPDEFALNKGSLEDISTTLQLGSTIRAGVAKHGLATTIYHIYVGLNYEVS